MKIYVLSLLVLILFGCSEQAADKIKHESYYIGFKKIQVQSEKTNEQFPVTLLYPTNIPSKNVKFGPFKMDLSIGANIANGQFPLVIISHGSGGTNLGHRSIAFELVKNGYIVGVPLHPEDNFKNNSAEGTNKNWKNRPVHISASIDKILLNKEISKNIDANKIAVIGHSAGGYTALATAGGVADTSHIIDICLSKPERNEPFCGLVKENKIKPEKILNTRDKRVKAIVLMAPLGVLFKSEDSLNNVNIPVLLLSAEKDNVLKEPYHSEMIAKNFKKSNLLTHHVVPNAGHYSFITPFPESIKENLGVVAQDPEGFDRRAFHKKLSHDIIQFLNGALSSEM